MTCNLKIISATNLPHLENEEAPSSFIEVWGKGPKKFFLGKTNIINSNDNPTYDATISFAFFRCYELTLVIKHHRTIVQDVELCRTSVDLADITYGEPFDIEIQTNGAHYTMPILKLSFEHFASPLPTIEMRKAKAYFVFMTFEHEQSLDTKPQSIPVEIFGINMYDDGTKTSILDCNSNWNYLGGSTKKKLIKTRSGWTQVHRISKPITNKMRTSFILLSNDYTGLVSVHVIGAKKEEESVLHAEYLEPVDEKISVVHKSDIHIEKGVKASVDFYINEDFQIIYCKSIKYEDESFENKVIDSISPVKNIYTRRYLTTKERIVLPQKFTFIAGSTIYAKNGADIKMCINLYDRAGNKIDSWNNRFQGFFQIRNGRRSIKIPYRYIDYQYWTVDFSNTPDDLEFMTVVASSLKKMYYYHFEQKYVRVVTDLDTDEEITFTPLSGTSGDTCACYVYSISKVDNQWCLIPSLKYFDSKKTAKQESRSIELKRRNYY